MLCCSVLQRLCCCVLTNCRARLNKWWNGRILVGKSGLSWPTMMSYKWAPHCRGGFCVFFYGQWWDQSSATDSATHHPSRRLPRHDGRVCVLQITTSHPKTVARLVRKRHSLLGFPSVRRYLHRWHRWLWQLQPDTPILPPMSKPNSQWESSNVHGPVWMYGIPQTEYDWWVWGLILTTGFQKWYGSSNPLGSKLGLNMHGRSKTQNPTSH